MTIRLVSLVALTLSLLAGCSSAPPKKTEPIEVTVTVTLPNGQPAANVTLNMFPTSSDQTQGGGKLDAAGKAKTKLTPGKYTYSLEGAAAAMQAVPKKYHSNDAANAVEVTSGATELAIKLSN